MGSRFLAPEDQKQNWGALFVLAESEKWGGLPLKDQQAFITEQITPVIALRSVMCRFQQEPDSQPGADKDQQRTG